MGEKIGPQTQHWSAAYYESLEKGGWQFDVPTGNVRSKMISRYDSQTPDLVSAWIQSQEPVEMSIVVVTPNTPGIESMPVRSLGYAVSALNLSATLSSQEVNMGSLRIISPCHVNALVNGGNPTQQIENAQEFANLIRRFKDNYYPQFPNMEITLDTGIEIGEGIDPELLRRVYKIAESSTDIATSLSEAAKTHQTDDSGIDTDYDYRSLLYLFAHPEAWGYSDDSFLFEPNGRRRVNFMPQSELRYLDAMNRIRGIWTPSTDKEIATLVSSQQTFPPYYPVKGFDEPTLGDLHEKGIDACITPLRRGSGRIEVAEIISNLNLVGSPVQSSTSERKREGLPKPASLTEVLSPSRLEGEFVLL